MNVNLTIDGRAVAVAPGATVLEAARVLGIDIPTLCYLPQCGPATSCLVCLVNIKVNGQSRLVPSCATKVLEGLVVESETPEVHQARRAALELLLSDHAGDCFSPCQRICPLQLNIPVMLRQVQTGRVEEAIATVRSSLPLPGILGRLCHHPCENGCRRNTWDQSAAIRDVERFVADADLRAAQPYQPPVKPSSGKSVVVVGAGPAGLAAAFFLLRQGHACSVVDRHPQPGGSLRSPVDEQALPRPVLDAEIQTLERLGARFLLGVELGKDLSLKKLVADFDAVLIAIGEIAPEEAVALGLRSSPAGIAVDPETCQTGQAGIFAAGSAVKRLPQIVRAMSEGQAAAQCVHQFLGGQPSRRPDRPFSSVMGRLDQSELNLFMLGPNPGSRVSPCQACAGFNSKEAATEAGRCLHCDCRASGNCALQHYAAVYGADPGRYRSQRRRFEQQRQPGGVIFEPGKCILCGICVQLTEQAREPLGLTFIGRGFNVRIGAPLRHTITAGLQKVARECVEHCPTGALSFDEASHSHEHLPALPALPKPAPNRVASRLAGGQDDPATEPKL